MTRTKSIERDWPALEAILCNPMRFGWFRSSHFWLHAKTIETIDAQGLAGDCLSIAQWAARWFG
eukprot:3812763-Amphidinium_carterae.1